nr:MAG TPA: hypothetical protein [Caudoviricetes sp.]
MNITFISLRYNYPDDLLFLLAKTRTLRQLII